MNILTNKIYNGTLNYQDYNLLIRNKYIFSKDKIPPGSIQPASIDLRLSKYAYEVRSSFLSKNNKVKDVLKEYMIKKIDINNGYLFKKNKTYIVEIEENLNLDINISGKCNPKSSTGRLDIFCRVITDFNSEFEVIKNGYKGKIYLEITSKTFNVVLFKGDKLNQLRLRNKKTLYLNDTSLCNLNKKIPLIYDKNSNSINPIIKNGIKISADIDTKESIVCYKAKKNSPKIIFNKINYYNIKEFWIPIKKDRNKSIIIEPNEFYILKSKEKICIPSNLAAEMIPYDTNMGEFRVHYAGFFDPGFGLNNFGSHAVLEIKTHEVPFAISDDQNVARLIFEKLAHKPDKIYGYEINSNYQNQELKLSKNFKQNDRND